MDLMDVSCVTAARPNKVNNSLFTPLENQLRTVVDTIYRKLCFVTVNSRKVQQNN